MANYLGGLDVAVLPLDRTEGLGGANECDEKRTFVSWMRWMQRGDRRKQRVSEELEDIRSLLGSLGLVGTRWEQLGVA